MSQHEAKTVLVVGTFDTKDDELNYICEVIQQQGGKTLCMDVSVLGDPSEPTDYSKHQVAEANGSSIAEAIDSGDENRAMQIMASGAAKLTSDLYQQGEFDAVLVLGGSMGTDLALDVCNALPLGVPKYIVSTISFSSLIPADRLPADVQMILWAGGLYGLNSVCRASLSQAAGAVLGAARAAQKPEYDRPLIGMTSFGKSALKYMVALKPEIEKRGFDLVVFHATGMGGRAFESLAEQGAFACVMDFATQEVGNHLNGSSVTAGEDRLTAAGRSGTPQMVAPGCYDLVDLVGWQEIPAVLQGLPTHAHNRLLTAVVLDKERRCEVARTLNQKLSQAKGETVFLLPEGGCCEWDRPGEDLNDPQGLSAFVEELQNTVPQNVQLETLDCHINDQAFADAALKVLDNWIEQGIVTRGVNA